jgi:histidine kinase
MNTEIKENREELIKLKEEYQNIFDLVPCYITIQDRDFKLIKYNREFAEHFKPQQGDYCYEAYKGRSERCEICPVVKTFKDGKSHYSEEEGINKDGTKSLWVVRTAPIKDSQGEITTAMEMSLDITHVKRLEKKVQKSERKYRAMSWIKKACRSLTVMTESQTPMDLIERIPRSSAPGLALFVFFKK